MSVESSRNDKRNHRQSVIPRVEQSDVQRATGRATQSQRGQRMNDLRNQVDTLSDIVGGQRDRIRGLEQEVRRLERESGALRRQLENEHARRLKLESQSTVSVVATVPSMTQKPKKEKKTKGWRDDIPEEPKLALQFVQDDLSKLELALDHLTRSSTRASVEGRTGSLEAIQQGLRTAIDRVNTCATRLQAVQSVVRPVEPTVAHTTPAEGPTKPKEGTDGSKSTDSVDSSAFHSN